MTTAGTRVRLRLVSHPVSSTDMTSSDRICTMLELDPLNKNTCSGRRRDGQPCRAVVAYASRLSAHDTLGECVGLAADSRRLRKNLRQAARLLLCKRWHQDQYSSLVDDWLEIWSEQDSDDSSSESEVEDIPFATPRRGRQSSSQRQGQRQRQAASDGDSYPQLVRNILESNISSEAKVTFLRLLTAGDGNPADRIIRSNASSANSQPQPIEPVRLVWGANEDSSPSTPALTRSTTSSTSDESPPAASEVTNAPVPMPVPTEPAGPSRHSHIECCVCTEPYRDDDNRGVWECRTCHNRTHMDCHQEWSASNSGSTTCVYCRTVVETQV